MWILPFGTRASQQSIKASRCRSEKRFRTHLESLEERSLLATVTVSITDTTFTPSAVTIRSGDTVRWVFSQGAHSTTSVGGSAESWDSDVRTPPAAAFERIFTTIGTFQYYCTLHGFDNGNGTAGGMSGSVTVTAAAALQSIAITPANPSIAAGTTQQFVAIGTLSDNTTQDLSSQVTWVSANPAVASISTTGRATGLAGGTSTISASLNGIIGTTVLTVKTTTLQSIAIAPVNPSIVRGQNQQFSAVATFSDNSTQDVTSQVTWTSAVPGVATISASGLASGVGVGTTTITASLSGVSSSTVLTVNAPPVPPNPLFVATGVRPLKFKLNRRLNKTVANFKNPQTLPTDFQAVIDWGDGTATTIGRIRRIANGRYQVTAAHAYAAIGSFRATITIRDREGRERVVVDQVRVARR